MAEQLNIAFIGAGGINFGGAEGPWDHASRLEKIGGLRVVGVADPNIALASRQLAHRSHSMYREAEVFADYREMLDRTRPDAVWIGIPPDAHGTATPSRSIEAVCAEAGVHMLVEKPLSSSRPDEVRSVAQLLAASNVIVSVGYMFRYAQAVETMRDILAAAPGGARAFIARYNCAYSEIRKKSWWDMRMCGGPIVEQATHFLDLARYLVGDPDPGTIQALRIESGGPLGYLSDRPVDENGFPYDEDIPVEHQVPRLTAANWRFQGGAVGSLVHGVFLHGKNYYAELEIWGDGLRMELAEPYDRCRLRVRRPGSEELEEITFAEDDPYLSENEAFVEAVRSGDSALVRSSYADALKTHELAWDVTDAGAPDRAAG